MDLDSRPDFIFTVEADDGQRFIVQHFPATSPAPVDVTSIRDRHTQVIPGDRYETVAGDRVEPELIPHGNGHTSMAFWIHRVQGRVDDNGVLVVPLNPQRIKTQLVDGPEYIHD